MSFETNDKSRAATFATTTVEGLVFETVLNFAQRYGAIFWKGN